MNVSYSAMAISSGSAADRRNLRTGRARGHHPDRMKMRRNSSPRRVPPGATLPTMDVTELVRDSLPVNPPYEGVVAEAYDEWLPPSTAHPDHRRLHDLIVAG